MNFWRAKFLAMRGFTGSIERYKFFLDGFGQTVLESLHFQLDLLKLIKKDLFPKLLNLLKSDISLFLKRPDDARKIFANKYQGQKFASKTRHENLTVE